MSRLFSFPGGRGPFGLPPVTVALAGAVALVGLARQMLPLLREWLGAPVGGAGSPLEVWRMVTHVLVPSGLLPLVMAVVFVAWIGSAVETELGPRTMGAIAAVSAMSAAIALQWIPLGGQGFLGTGSVLAWGMLAALIVYRWSRGDQITQQLILVGLLLVLSFVQGGAWWMIDVVTLMGGTLAGAVAAWLPRRRPDRNYYEAFDRRRNRRRAEARQQWYGYAGLAAVLVVAWLAGFFV